MDGPALEEFLAKSDRRQFNDSAYASAWLPTTLDCSTGDEWTKTARRACKSDPVG